MSGETAAPTPGSQAANPTRPGDWRLLETLQAHDGPRGICPTVARLAMVLHVSESTVQRSVRRLKAAGLVDRLDVYERDDDPEWQRRRQAGEAGIAPRRQTRNAYRITPAAVSEMSKVTPAPRVNSDTMFAPNVRSDPGVLPAETPIVRLEDSDTPEGKEANHGDHREVGNHRGARATPGGTGQSDGLVRPRPGSSRRAWQEYRRRVAAGKVETE